MPAGRLDIGTSIVTRAGPEQPAEAQPLVGSSVAPVTITGIEVKEQAATVYNFTVADFHTYFVGRVGLWVHNECPGPGDDLFPGSVGNPEIYPIEYSDTTLGQMADKHMPGGIDSEGKSLFNPAEDLGQLAKAGEVVRPEPQAHGSFKRVVDAGRIIGTDRTTGCKTLVYTIVTDAGNQLLSIHPGR